MLRGFQTCLHAYRDQLKSDADLLLLIVHWHLIQNGLTCIVEDKNTEILPDNWNQSPNEYFLSYSYESKGYELKLLVIEDSVVINLVKKIDDRSASLGCLIKDHVVDYKNSFNNMFKNLNDLLEKINKEFKPLIQRTQLKPEQHSKEDISLVAHNKHHVDIPRQPYAPPDNYGRCDLDPFSPFDTRPGMGGMIFDPFRGSNRTRIPGNLPPGAVPPGARFDPFGPPNPDDFSGGSAMRAGPNPDYFKPPQFEDPFM